MMVCRPLLYGLWLFFGLAGAHHFYLRRYRHGLVWLCTLGGFFCGWLRDLFVMSDYIRERLEDEEGERKEEGERNGIRQTQQSLHVSYRHRETDIGASYRQQQTDIKPKSSWTRNCGQVTFAAILSVTFQTAVPEELLEESACLQFLANWGAAFFSAIGIHIVGNIGRHSLQFKWCLGPALFANCLFPAGSQTALYGLVGSTIAANWFGKGWKPRKRGRRSAVKPMAAVALFFLLYLSMWFSGLWFNTYVTTNDGERVKLKDAVNNFFTSPAWREMKETLSHLYEYYKMHGFANIYREFIQALDPEGESNAYNVLALGSSAAPQEITSTCRKLSRKYHPDKARGEEAKKEAAAKFIEVQSACQVLDKLRKRRAQRSRDSAEL